MDRTAFAQRVGALTVRKQLPDAVYRHAGATALWPADLHEEVEAARSLAQLAPGTFQVVKLPKRERKISFLSYPGVCRAVAGGDIVISVTVRGRIGEQPAPPAPPASVSSGQRTSPATMARSRTRWATSATSSGEGGGASWKATPWSVFSNAPSAASVCR
jgi:hypothetical protein